MKRLILKFSVLACFACGGRVVLADTPVSGTIFANTTWTLAGSPYIVTGTVFVQNTITPPTLTIQAGVTVKFNAGTALEIGLQYPAALQAIGTAAQPIVFTANSASPSPGFWQWIRFSTPALSTSRISYATVSYGQGIRVEGSSPTLDNLTLSHNTQAGLTVTGGSPILSNSTADSNDRGVYVSYPGSPSLQTVSITNNAGFAISVEPKVTLGTCGGVTAASNGTDAIEIRVGDNIDTTTTWRNVSSLPYVVISRVQAFRATAPVLVFSIEPGTTIRWRPTTYLLVSQFADLEAVGTSGQQITFTSDSATPHAGDWLGIQVYTTASHISYANIRYAGWLSTRAALQIGSSSPTIDHCTVSDNIYAALGVADGSPTITNSTLSNSPWGLYLTGTSSPSVAGTTISGNATGGIYAAPGSSPSLQNVTITNNSGYAMTLDSATTLGSVSGLAVSGNNPDAVELRLAQIQQNTSWKNLGVPGLFYALTGGGRVEGTGSNNPLLTIEAGVTLKFAASTALLIGGFGKGQLQAIGTPGQPISFGPLSGSAPGSWYGLQFTNTPITSRVSYASVTYAGGSGISGGIDLYPPGPGRDPLSVVLDHLTLSSNANAGVSGGGSGSTISNCSFIGNPMGIRNAESGLNAQLNWWESASGPSGIGSGTGESVSVGVLFEPWLTAAPSYPNYIASAVVTNRRFNPLSSDLATWNLTSSESGNWTITISNGSDVVVRTLTGAGTPVALQWNGKDQSGTITEPDGRYTYLIQTSAGTDSATSAKGFVFVDRTFQLAITAPADGFVISNVYQTGPDVTVSGSVTMIGLTSWELDYGLGSTPNSWTQISSGTQPIVGGTLGIWSTLPLSTGTYTLRLLAIDNQLSQITRFRTVSVQNFSVSQSALQMNVAVGGSLTYSSVVPFSLTETLVVKNAAGQIVRTLLNGIARLAGTYSDVWDGKSGSAALLPDGPYFYVASVTDGTHFLTWDLTGQNYDNHFEFTYPTHQAFDPFRNSPWVFTYNFIQTGRVTIVFSPGPFVQNCNPPQFCILDHKYEESGLHTISWAGVDNTGAFRGDVNQIAISTERAAFSKNAVVLFGTKPTVANLHVTPAFYGPTNGTQTIEFDLTTYQNQNANIAVTILNQGSVSVLRNLSRAGQAPGHVTMTWDGRADNGMWVAPGGYTVTVTATDALGNQAKAQVGTTIEY